ncbi:MAG: hypothetical protein ACQERS_11305 [Bacteroidota bacterium]
MKTEDYNKIRSICDENKEMSKKVVDDFLIYYAASRNKLKLKMEQSFNKYKHVTDELDESLVNMLKAQYLAHKIFKQDGDINKLINHSALQRLSREEKAFLEDQSKHPWRFSFSMIINNPDEDFYIMEDIFSYEEYLLFSPSVSDILSETQVITWFNLIGYNGVCWQSYGPIGAFTSFEPDDIFFFATELNAENDDEERILKDIESNPLPYMLLIMGANYPVTVHKDDLLVQNMSEYELDDINTEELKNNFKTEYNEGVYRFSLKGWDEHPHFAIAFFDENAGKIVLSALTDRGFSALVKALRECGYSFPYDPFIRVKLSMLATAGKILKKQILLNEYDHLFASEPNEKEKESLDRLNTFMGLALPDINAGREPDIEALAKQAGIDIETAHGLIRAIRDKKDEMGKNME